MTKEELEEELEEATGQEIIDERNHCGVDGYYGDYLDKVNAEMLRRFNRLEELEQENVELKEQNRNYEQLIDTGSVTLVKEKLKNYKHLTKAKAIIKDYMIIATGGNITVCSVPEENRCINVLKLNEQAKQFLKEIE